MRREHTLIGLTGRAPDDGLSGRRRRSRGQSLAEFSLAIPLFMLVFLAIAEGGYYVAATTIVSSATHEGARLGVLESTSSRAVIRNRVQEAAGPIVSLDSTAINLEIAKVNADGTYQSLASCNNTCYTARKKDDRLVVATAYTHTPLVGYVFRGITFPADAQAELTVEGDAP